MTMDVKDYITLIHVKKRVWNVNAALFVVGMIITVLGMRLFSLALQQAGQKIFPQIGFFAFSFGSAFWILNIAFRATVTVWAANQLSESNSPEPSFQSWMDWTNIIFAIYMVLAYFS